MFVDIAIQLEVRFIVKQNMSEHEKREQRQSRFGLIRQNYVLLDDRLATILARVGFRKHANQDFPQNLP